MAKPTRMDDCQYLLSSLVNYTLTHFADHSDQFTHDLFFFYRSFSLVKHPFKLYCLSRNAQGVMPKLSSALPSAPFLFSNVAISRTSTTAA